MKARITSDGDIECPHCHTRIITPVARNPHKRGREEKMVVRSLFPDHCPICQRMFYLTPEEARKHNRHWFPNDPEFLSPEFFDPDRVQGEI